MAHTVTFADAFNARPTESPVRRLELLERELSVRELIRRRVYEECTEFNASRSGVFHGLVVPEQATHTAGRKHLVTWEEQEARALDAFVNGRLLIFVDDRQVDDPEEMIALSANRPTEMVFVKLVALIGG